MAGSDLVFNMLANTSNFAAGMKAAQKAADSLFLGTRTNLEKFQMELANVQSLKDKGLIDSETTKRAQGQLVQHYDPFGFIAAEKDAKAANERMVAEAAKAAAAQQQIAKQKADYIAQVSENAKRMEYAHLQQITEARQRQAQAEQAIADESQKLAQSKADYIAKVSENAARMEFRHIQQIKEARQAQLEAEQKAAAQMQQIEKGKADYLAGVVERSKRMEWNHLQQISDARLTQAQSQEKIQADMAKRTASIIASERAAVTARRSAEIAAENAQAAKILAIKEKLAERIGRAQMRETIRDGQAAQLMSGGIGGNRSMIIQQLAFAAEDAATQFGTRGFAGALMAAGNNLTFAASMMNPTIGIIASIGLTAAMVGSLFFKFGNEAQEAAKKADKLRDASENLRKSFAEYQQFRDTVSGIKSAGDSDSTAKQINNEMEQLRRDAALYSTKRSQLIDEANVLAKKDQQKTFFGKSDLVQRYIDGQKLADVQKRMNDLISEEENSRNRIALLLNRQIELSSRQIEVNKRESDIRAETLQMNSEFDLYSMQWQEAEQIWEKIKTPQEKYEEGLSRINNLKREGLLTDEETLRAEKQLADETFKKKKMKDSEMLSGAFSKGSTEAYGVMANSIARSYAQLQPAKAPEVSQTDKNIEKNGAAAVKILEKMLTEFGRQKKTIPVVGLN